MADRPILMAGPLVVATLEGRKTQTRRVMAPSNSWIDHAARIQWQTLILERGGRGWVGDEPVLVVPTTEGHTAQVRCRWSSGDRPWVRETWAPHDEAPGGFVYRAAPNYSPECYPPVDAWRPSIHMPRRASRLTLVVDAVRSERVQDISEEDARAEGVVPLEWMMREPQPHRLAFAALWDQINGKRQGYSWLDNPWNWAITYHVER